jgi:hypothetical protein
MKNLARLLLPTALVLGVLSPTPAGAVKIVLDVEVETANRAVGTSHTVTATVTDVDPGGGPVAGDEVAFAVASGQASTPPVSSAPHPFLTEAKVCTTDATTGQCSFEITGTAAGTSVIRAWLRDTTAQFSQEQDSGEARDETATPGAAEPDGTDVVEVTWVAAVLDLEPETSTPPPGSETILIATVKDATAAANPVEANVDVEVIDGPNKNKKTTGADLECDTDASTGTCELKYTGSATPGLDTVRGWIDLNDNGINAPETGAKGDEVPGEADTTEKTDATVAGGAGGKAEPDQTDVVDVDWGGTAKPAPGTPGGGLDPAEFCSKTRDKANQKEILVGDEFANRICGFGGNDAIRGLSGNDVLLGGEGDDKLKGGDGNDKLNGQAGKKDVSIGGKGKDKCSSEKQLTCEGAKKKKKKKK